MTGILSPLSIKKGGDIMTTFEELYLFLTFCLVVIEIALLLKKVRVSF
ncbi:hypothetical protein C820_001690 [Clostridium sp. MD294]|nr:hypothetical protein C820_001690 [Clostridium sp. MD294]